MGVTKKRQNDDRLSRLHTAAWWQLVPHQGGDFLGLKELRQHRLARFSHQIIFDAKKWEVDVKYGYFTSSTAQGGGGSFKNRKPIGEVGCCESGMAERSHWWTERWLRSPLFLSLSLTIYLPTYLPIYLSMYLCIYLSIDLPLSLSLLTTFRSIYVYLSTYLSIYLSLSLFHLSICLAVYLSICLSIYLSICLSVVQCHSV